VCSKCSKFVVHLTYDDIDNICKLKLIDYRIGYIRRISKDAKKCINCGAWVFKFKFMTDPITKVMYIVSNDKEVTPAIVYEILKNISDMNSRIMGYGINLERPENMFLREISIDSLPQLRPSQKGDFY
jgi:hypothetical protein